MTTPWLSLHLRPNTDVDAAWDLLEANGITPLFSSETPEGICEIIVEASEKSQQTFSFIDKIVPYEGAQETDWTAQWQTHGHQFSDGYVHVDVGGTILKLSPGPGFGDLSHPTTLLTLQLMTPHVKDHYVLDIGSGSGILTVAAAALNAKHAYGVDIDADAVVHAQRNAEINILQRKTTFCLPEGFIEPTEPGKWVVVINMIWSEQRQAWPMWIEKANRAEKIIVSGLLATERGAYLSFVNQWGWALIDEHQQGEWIALTLKPKVALPS